MRMAGTSQCISVNQEPDDLVYTHVLRVYALGVLCTRGEHAQRRDIPFTALHLRWIIRVRILARDVSVLTM